MGRSRDDFTDGLVGAEPPIQSVICPDGLREFIILPLWMVNDFVSTIKESHFNILKEKFQIPENIPLYLPYKSEKCYYEGVEGGRAQIPIERFPRSPSPILRVGHHTNFSKFLEGFSWRGGFIQGHVQRGTSVNGGRIFLLLPFD